MLNRFLRSFIQSARPKAVTKLEGTGINSVINSAGARDRVIIRRVRDPNRRTWTIFFSYDLTWILFMRFTRATFSTTFLSLREIRRFISGPFIALQLEASFKILVHSYLTIYYLYKFPYH
jgi:hypothetical protein